MPPVVVTSRLLFGQFDGRSEAKQEAGIIPASLGPSDIVLPAVAPLARDSGEPRERHSHPRATSPETPHARHGETTPRVRHPAIARARANKAPITPRHIPAGAPEIGAHDFAAHSALGAIPTASPAASQKSPAAAYAGYEADAARRRRDFAEHIKAGGEIGKARAMAGTPGAPYSPPPSRGVRPTEHFTRENVQALRESAARLGLQPRELAEIVAHETNNTFSPSIKGGAGRRYMGLIQFGPSERRQFGVHPGQTFREQLGSAERFLASRGYRPGMGQLDAYSTILAGRPGRYRARDINGSVAQHVARMAAQHREVVDRFLSSGGSGGGASPQTSASSATPATALSTPTTTAGR